MAGSEILKVGIQKSILPDIVSLDLMNKQIVMEITIWL